MAVAVVAALMVIGGVVWLSRPRGTVGHFKHWLGQNCDSVDHRVLRQPQHSQIPTSGITTDDQFICNMETGSLDVATYRDHESRDAALAGGRLRGACIIGSSQIATEALIYADHRAMFKRWCDELHGSIA
jgi:hypothetical protein